jgi:hypothetical protein
VRNNASKEPLEGPVDAPIGYVVPYPKHFLEVRVCFPAKRAPR